MMIRSSSTPVLGSLLSPIPPENPSHNHHDITLHPCKSSFLFHQTLSPGSQHFTTLSCNSSPMSPSFGLRRAQSDGNLESLMSSGSCGRNNNDYDSNDNEDFSFFIPPKKQKHSSRFHSSLLETIPSFSYQDSRFKSDEDESDEEQEEELEGFCGFDAENKVLSLNKQMGIGKLEVEDDKREGGYEMYLAKGLGVDAGFGCAGGGAAGSGGGGSNLCHAGGGGGGENHDVEEHYLKMVNECPGNPLLLGNYAQFLYQTKQDLQGAEEYYSRAILVDPNDGEILSQYAKLLWELHRDKERATTYFERAIQAASEDSHVHAAYASFLWETEDEEEEGYYSNIPPLFNNGKMASAATA